jgi:hypothetical protein
VTLGVVPGPASERAKPASGEEILIFLHIPKTAGSTVVHVLEQQYGLEGLLKMYDSTFGDEVAALSDEELSRTRAIVGHFYFGLHNRLPRPCRYLTFLREPVERVVSHYEFARRRPEHYLHQQASTMSLPDYVRFCGAAEPNNDQTRLLADREMASTDGTCSPAMLSAAKRNLGLHAAVGFTEEFDTSLVLMRRVFGWRRPFYVRHNVRGRRLDEPLPGHVREVIEVHNSLDIELYRHARDRFRDLVAEQGERLDREVRVFRQLNALYGRLHGIVHVSRRPPARRRV